MDDAFETGVLADGDVDVFGDLLGESSFEFAVLDLERKDLGALGSYQL